MVSRIFEHPKSVCVVAAVIRDADRIFATQRGYGEFKDKWEFPGGKMEPGETPEEALRREIREELSADISVDRFVCTVEHDYPTFHLTMHTYLCQVVSGHLQLLEHEAAKWLDIAHLDSVDWLPADLKILPQLKKLLQTKMKILILNGSPKGENSITLQTCLYIRKHFPQHEYEVLHVGQKIRQFEKDFAPAAEALNSADLVLFCYPVYTFLAPSQLHRFVELMKEHKDELAIEGKWATQITTSKHFYDVTAHRFIEENAKDLGFNVLPGLSADMEDLLNAKGREEALQFFDYLMFQISPAQLPDIQDKEVALVCDISPEDEALQQMVSRFQEQMSCKIKLINIREYPFKGGCISCFNCSADGKCIYADGFDKYLREEIQTCDAIVYAFTVRDHSMGSRFKMYDDRQFCNGHRTVTMGSPTGYLVNGAYATESNLQMVVEARANVGGNYLCGVAVNDGVEDPVHRTMSVDQLALRLSYALANGYRQPANFFGVGGMRIFRDLIYQMRGMMRADHKFFKSHGQYDFPQKQWKKSLMMYLVGWMMHNRKLKSKMGDKMNEGMMKPYKDVLEG